MKIISRWKFHLFAAYIERFLLFHSILRYHYKLFICYWRFMEYCLMCNHVACRLILLMRLWNFVCCWGRGVGKIWGFWWKFFKKIWSKGFGSHWNYVKNMAISRASTVLPQKGDHFDFVENHTIWMVFSIFFTKPIIFLKTTTQYLSKTPSVVKIG